MDDIRYYGPDSNGVEVAWPGADQWLVGTWQYDAVSGPIRDLATRMADRLGHGDEDWAPLKVYLLVGGGGLRACELQTFEVDGYRMVAVADVARPPAVEVASFRIKL